MNDLNKKKTESEGQVSEPLLWSARQVAFHCGLSVRSIWRAASAGLLPPALKVMGSTRWHADHIRRWASMGCPTQKEFVARLEAENAN